MRRIYLIIACSILIGVVSTMFVGRFLKNRYAPTMNWTARDGTVIICRDVVKSRLTPDWGTIYKVLPGEAKGKTFEVVLMDSVPGAVDGRLVLETKTGWVMYVQLGDVPKGNRQSFANAAVVYSSALIAGETREVAVSRVMQMAQTPTSFR